MLQGRGVPSVFEYEWNIQRMSVQRSVMNKTYPKRRDFLFSFNLNLDLFTLALENLYFNTLAREKVQGEEFRFY